VLSSSIYPAAQLPASHVIKYPGAGQSSSHAVIRQFVQSSGQLVQEFVSVLYAVPVGQLLEAMINQSFPFPSVWLVAVSPFAPSYTAKAVAGLVHIPEGHGMH